MKTAKPASRSRSRFGNLAVICGIGAVGRGRPSPKGYALLDVVLAVAVFALAVTGYVGVMQRINETSTEYARDRFVQQRLVSLLDQTRQRPLRSMTSETQDPLAAVTFRTYVEPWQVENGQGGALADLYLLTAEAVFEGEEPENAERAQIVIHVPREQR